jgi:hypothetical protein
MGTLSAINTSIAQTNVQFEAFVKAVAEKATTLGYKVQYRIDKTIAGDATPLSTNATAQVDVTKNNITARAAITYFHFTSQSVTQVAGMLDRTWIAKANWSGVSNVPSHEFSGGDPVVNDPITQPNSVSTGTPLPGMVSTTSQIFTPPQSSDANRPGVSNTTVPSGSSAIQTTPNNGSGLSSNSTVPPQVTEGSGQTAGNDNIFDRFKNGNATQKDMLILIAIVAIGLYFALR